MQPFIAFSPDNLSLQQNGFVWSHERKSLLLVTVKVTRNAFFSDSCVESQHTPEPKACCEVNPTFFERVLRLYWLAFSSETFQLRFCTKCYSGALDDRSTWHNSAGHSSRKSSTQLPADDIIADQATQRTRLGVQSQLWHSCEVNTSLLPNPLTLAHQGKTTQHVALYTSMIHDPSVGVHLAVWCSGR